MSTDDLASTLNWEKAPDNAMVGRMYVPILKASIEKAGKLRVSPAFPVSTETGQNNQKKRSRSAERRKGEKRAAKKRRRAEDISTKTDNGEANLAAVLQTLGVAIKPRPHMLAINTTDRMRALALDGSFDLDQSPPQMAVRKLLPLNNRKLWARSNTLLSTWTLESSYQDGAPKRPRSSRGMGQGTHETTRERWTQWRGGSRGADSRWRLQWSGQ